MTRNVCHQALKFQSTLPARGSDSGPYPQRRQDCNFNPRSPRGGATLQGQRQNDRVQISIHAPREGERLAISVEYMAKEQFQSTLPARGSDRTQYLRSKEFYDFNPRSPRGGATFVFVLFAVLSSISIHAPREGERQLCRVADMLQDKFQSTLPARGSDQAPFPKRKPSTHFNPRSPRGGATTLPAQASSIFGEFQSTLPARGSDGSGAVRILHPGYFNPRSPRGGATLEVGL